jgi:DNA-binding NarL/FixJ family response regulator
MTSPAPLPSAPITVALVEDQSGLRDSLQEIFSVVPGLTCIAACANAEQALVQLPPLAPTVVFMDINLPGMDGVSCVRELAPKLPDTFFIMLTALDNTEAVFNSLAAGACGYLHKPVTTTKLAEAVHEVVAGGSPMSAKIARIVVQAFNKPAPTETTLLPTAKITELEQAVL